MSYAVCIISGSLRIAAKKQRATCTRNRLFFFLNILSYLIVQTPFRNKIVFLMKLSPRLPRKCEILAEVNGVHPTTIRVQKCKEVTTACVMHIRVDGINFIICLHYKPDKISLSPPSCFFIF